MEQTARTRERSFVDLDRVEYGAVLVYACRRTDEAKARDATAETFLAGAGCTCASPRDQLQVTLASDDTAHRLSRPLARRRPRAVFVDAWSWGCAA